MTDVAGHNRRAWDQQVERGNQWTVPVGPEVIAAARKGDWHVVLTPTRPVPAAWFPPLEGAKTLCLASGGGQQAPILAAAGAEVTTLDNSPRQLAQDRLVAERDGLQLATVLGDMRAMPMFADQSFDLIFHPCSNCFVPDVRPVWREAFRVLKPGGVLLAGFFNPAAFIFDDALAEQGVLEVRYPLPYSDTENLSPERLQRLVDAGEPFVFSHTLESLLGGQMEAGFAIVAMYEDVWPKQPITKYMPAFLATRAVRPPLPQ